MLRKALFSLLEKGYVVQENPDKERHRPETEFILKPEMTQQAGQEYFPKPEGLMEKKRIKIKIKLKIISNFQKLKNRKAI